MKIRRGAKIRIQNLRTCGFIGYLIFKISTYIALNKVIQNSKEMWICFHENHAAQTCLKIEIMQ